MPDVVVRHSSCILFRPLVPACFALLLGATGCVDAQPASPSPLQASDSAAAVSRAQVISSLIDRHRVWSGGHGPLPRRAITASTMQAVWASLSKDDVPALIILASDEAIDVRSASAHWIWRMGPSAISALSTASHTAKAANEKSRLDDALLLIKSLGPPPAAE